MMDMRGVKREVKFAEWTRLIHECVSSGKTIKAWCEENGISRRMYSYWQRRIREEVIGSIVLNDACTPGITSAGNNHLASLTIRPDSPAFTKVPLAASSSSRNAVSFAMNVRIGLAECEIYNGADMDVVERTILTIMKTC
jgi:hypothetical protein